ncbi:MAG: hypothetical protein U0S48_03580 [Solirubrobacteraceae bacterium]
MGALAAQRLELGAGGLEVAPRPRDASARHGEVGLVLALGRLAVGGGRRGG